MKRNKYTLMCVLLIIVLQGFLCSCTKGGNGFMIELSPQDKSLFEMSTKIYGEDELTTISSFRGTIQELDETFPIECIRKTTTGYRVTFCGNVSLVSLVFDNSGQIIFGSVYKISESKASFGDLTIGKTVEDVKKIDPSGSYMFLYSGRNDVPKQSIHYTNDGYLIIIEYDEKYCISNIVEELI